MDKFRTILDVLEWRASIYPTGVAFRFLSDGIHESGALTYEQLHQKAKSIAALIHHQAKPGDRAILLYSPGLDFIGAFLGCLYAGVVAVPLPLPRFSKANPRLKSAVTNAQPVLVLSTQDVVKKLNEKGSAFPYLESLRLLETDTGLCPDTECIELAGNKEDVAFLQYTSGSTSTPKGVMVTHENLLANVEMIHRGFGWHEDTIMVSWLPQFHDMGLIGNSLTPIYVGFPAKYERRRHHHYPDDALP